jgi:hypothetical protein
MPPWGWVIAILIFAALSYVWFSYDRCPKCFGWAKKMGLRRGDESEYYEELYCSSCDKRFRSPEFGDPPGVKWVEIPNTHSHVSTGSWRDEIQE